MTKRTYFLATFTALFEKSDEKEALVSAEDAAEAIDEYIGSMSDTDPLMYRVQLAGVVPYDGPDPFPDENEEFDVGQVRGIAHEAARLARLEPQRAIETIVGQLVDARPAPPTRCPHDIPFDDEEGCNACAVETRAYLSGLMKNPR